jgi:hypothetical protein
MKSSNLDSATNDEPAKPRAYRNAAHIANNAVRIFLERFGQQYDKERDLPLYDLVKDRAKILSFFNNACCYCATSLNEKSVNQDHLVPMNKASGGLHAWGNVVPSCQKCNSDKRAKPWKTYLSEISSKDELPVRIKKIEVFVDKYGYAPDVDRIKTLASDMYEEISHIAIALIDVKVRRWAKDIGSLRHATK